MTCLSYISCRYLRDFVILHVNLHGSPAAHVFEREFNFFEKIPADFFG